MNWLRIENIMNSRPETKRILGGVSAPDVPITPSRTYPRVVFLNTALSHEPGEHWCLTCFDDGRVCHFFDSYGRPPRAYNLDQVIIPHTRRILYNSSQVQGESTRTCGHHCLYFASQYARGLHPEEIVRSYAGLNQKRRDQMVVDYLVRRFGRDIGRVE